MLVTIIDGGNAFSQFTPGSYVPPDLTAPVFAPYAQTYSTRESYITPAEFVASPTGVNISTLVPGGTAAANADALVQIIARASAWADTICEQVLTATKETTAGTYRVQSDGRILVPVAYSPIVSVHEVLLGITAASRSPIGNLSAIEIDRKVVSIPALGLNGKASVSVTYVSGFANGSMMTNSDAGTSTITLDNVLGIRPGMGLTVHDPGLTELVQVLSIMGNTLMLVSPLIAAHAVGINVSSLPASIKGAVIQLASSLIKNRSSQAVELSSMRGQPSTQVTGGSSGASEQKIAREMLAPFRRII